MNSFAISSAGGLRGAWGHYELDEVFPCRPGPVWPGLEEDARSWVPQGGRDPTVLDLDEVALRLLMLGRTAMTCWTILALGRERPF